VLGAFGNCNGVSGGVDWASTSARRTCCITALSGTLGNPRVHIAVLAARKATSHREFLSQTPMLYSILESFAARQDVKAIETRVSSFVRNNDGDFGRRV
jgi:hypothetical protein